MPKGKKKNNRNPNQGRGRGRGGGGGGDGRQPLGGPGVVRNPQKQKNKARGGGRGGRSSQPTVSRAARKKGNKGEQQAVVEEVKEDAIVRHHFIPKAHSDAVMSVVVSEDAIYTASRDKFLKRWRAVRDATGRFQLQHDVDVELGDTCWCMIYVGEWLFCGLGSGTIKGFAKSGKQSVMTAHSKRVNAMLIHETVLLSCSQDSTVRLWQHDPNTQLFSCTHTISEGLPGNCSAMVVLGGHLWVGGSNGVAVVELTSLKVVHKLGPQKFVSGFLVFEGHVVVVYQDGAASIYDGTGTLKHSQAEMPAGPVLCIAGLESGPRILCGHSKGQLTSVTLPMFQMKTYWQAFDRCKVQCMACAGHDGIFLLGGENGSIQLWQRDEARFGIVM
eukprot:TRINITY_DN91572_c0_g1_i1.p1 TRINITY_DN91572_c0_g1~~TRINITY_DN91572_c0_g1_i1.p1  ORF type:complete len:387 (+),score=50.31 TRINITY_DN91572_c0_g1_i1:91-1251(+)